MQKRHGKDISPEARKLQVISSQIYGEEAPAEEKPAAQAAPIAQFIPPKPTSTVAAVSGQAFPTVTTPVLSITDTSPLHWAVVSKHSIAAVSI